MMDRTGHPSPRNKGGQSINVPLAAATVSRNGSGLTYWYFTASTVPRKYVDVRLATACCTQICFRDLADPPS